MQSRAETHVAICASDTASIEPAQRRPFFLIGPASGADSTHLSGLACLDTFR